MSGSGAFGEGIVIPVRGMKILLDECVLLPLGDGLVGHECTAVTGRGWRGTKNGALLTLAAAEFDAFITTGRNISFQRVYGRDR